MRSTFTGLGVGLTVKPAQNAYITVWSVGASGQVVQLFPNAFQKDNYVRGGRSLAIPDPKSGSQIKVSGPVVAELIKVVATSKPFKLVKDGLLREAGDFALGQNRHHRHPVKGATIRLARGG